jgi:hypothetical protein
MSNMDSTTAPKASRVKSNLPPKQKQRIRSRAKITPWSTPSEFDYVGKCLSHATCLFPTSNGNINATYQAPATLDEDSDAHRELVYGIQQVSIWRSRAENGRLPHSIDVTASMAQIMLQDSQYHIFNSNHQLGLDMTNSIKLSYAAIILRAVNGIADSIQRNRASYSQGYGSSVAALCSQIGLPLWIVDLRHDSAHNELPSLVPLRLAAKNLLGFFMEQYWTILDDLRGDWRNKGVELLKECKIASKAIDRVGMQIKMDLLKDQEQGDKVDDNDNEQDQCGNGRASDANYGAFSIFLELDKKKKKTTTKSKVDVDTLTATKPAKVKPHHMIDGRTPRQCLNEFFKTIPIDVGLDMIIQYLFDGGIGDAPDGRGILIPGSPTTFPETINSVRKIRERYSVILLSVAAKWPGFVHASLARIVDMIISLDRPTNDECGEYGKKRKIYFLKHWMFYLLSNEFYCFLHWHDVTWRGSKNIKERPKDKWSEELFLHMESCAPIEILQQARLPLNSFCDRFTLEGEGEESRNMVDFFENVLSNDRKSGVEIKKTCILAGLKRSIGDISTIDEINGMTDTRNDQCVMLNLEEMEGLLSENVEDKHDKEIIKEDSESKTGTHDNGISPWIICAFWEPCAIGSLPGYS